MKSSRATLSLAAIVLGLGSLVGLMSCASPSGDPATTQSTTKAVAATATAMAAQSGPPPPTGNPTKPGDPEHRPQSPYLKAGRLEPYMFFYGTIKDGQLVAKAPAQRSDTAGKIWGALDDDPRPYNQVSFVKQPYNDPCSRAEKKADLFPLPLYRITNDQGINYCEGQVLTVSSSKELLRCTEKENTNPSALDEGIRGFNSVHELAVAVPGYWNGKGEYSLTASSGDSVVTIACITGVVAKCAHWGYVPGQTYGANKKLEDYHSACVHAARAEYQPGETYTCGFTEIDIFDDIHIQEAGDQTGMKLESFWDKAGPTCRRHTRYKACQDQLDNESPPKPCDTPSLISVWSPDNNYLRAGPTTCPRKGNAPTDCYR